MKSKNLKRKSGQTMVEYIIVVVVIAVAALVVFGIFGDTIKKKMSGAVSSLDNELGTQAQAEAGKESSGMLKNLGADGSN